MTKKPSPSAASEVKTVESWTSKSRIRIQPLVDGTSHWRIFCCSSEDEWKFRYFPEQKSEPEVDPRSIFADRNKLFEVDAKCDDGIRNIMYDWDKSMIENYTCVEEIIKHDETIAPKVYSSLIPPAYTVRFNFRSREVEFRRVTNFFVVGSPLLYGHKHFLPRSAPYFVSILCKGCGKQYTILLEHSCILFAVVAIGNYGLVMENTSSFQNSDGYITLK